MGRDHQAGELGFDQLVLHLLHLHEYADWNWANEDRLLDLPEAGHRG